MPYRVSECLWQYTIERRHAEVDGWIRKSALSMIVLLARWQSAQGIRGGIVEIGVHHGQLFLALALAREAGEAAVAVDVFEDQHLNIDGSGLGDRARFEANLAKFGVTDARILKADSLRMRAADLRANLGGQPARLISVDGGHTVRHVLNDLDLANGVLADDGVVILDDFPNPDWPGVIEGSVRYLTRWRTPLVPFAYGDGKLYFCRRQAQLKYWDFASTALEPFHEHFKQVELCGHVIMHMYPRPLDASMIEASAG